MPRPNALVAALALLALLAAPRPAAADFVLTVSGRFDGLDPANSGSERFDGTDYFLNDLPPLFDLGRLAGGSFAATYRVPTGTPPTSVYNSGTTAFYELPVDRSGLSYTLFDAAGAAAYALVNPPVPAFAYAGAVVDNNNPGLSDRVFFQQGTDPVAGLNTPAPLGGELFTDGLVNVEFAGADPSVLTGLAIPTDTATYRRFGRGTFSPVVAWLSYSPDGASYSFVATGVNYRIDSVTVTQVAPVPVPPTAGLALLGGLAAVFARRRLAG